MREPQHARVSHTELPPAVCLQDSLTMLNIVLAHFHLFLVLRADSVTFCFQ